MSSQSPAHAVISPITMSLIKFFLSSPNTWNVLSHLSLQIVFFFQILSVTLGLSWPLQARMICQFSGLCTMYSVYCRVYHLIMSHLLFILDRDGFFTSILFLGRMLFCGSRKAKYMRCTAPDFVVITNCLVVLLSPEPGCGKGCCYPYPVLSKLMADTSLYYRINSFKVLWLDCSMIPVPSPLRKH